MNFGQFSKRSSMSRSACANRNLPTWRFSTLPTGFTTSCRTRNVNDDFARFLNENPVRPVHGSSTGRAALLQRTVYIEDTESDDSYTWKEAARQGGFRCTLSVPLVRDGVTVGVVAMADAKKDAYSAKQIALMETFAAQAVIAINNARLFEEVQARTAEVDGSARIPDCHLRSARRHLAFAQRIAAGAGGDPGCRGAAVQTAQRLYLAAKLVGRMLPHPFVPFQR